MKNNSKFIALIIMLAAVFVPCLMTLAQTDIEYEVAIGGGV